MRINEPQGEGSAPCDTSSHETIVQIAPTSIPSVASRICALKRFAVLSVVCTRRPPTKSGRALSGKPQWGQLSALSETCLEHSGHLTSAMVIHPVVYSREAEGPRQPPSNRTQV